MWPKRSAGEHRYRLLDLARVVFPEAGLFQSVGFPEYLHADPVEDAEAAARVVLAAQRAMGTNTLAGLFGAAGLALWRCEPDRCQSTERAWTSRHPVRIPHPCAISYGQGPWSDARRRAVCQDIRANLRGNPLLLERC
ncbi:hypothetical protein [Nonomuraea sp. NPDC003709]|uniref:hypothetical protein n=1 Tax=Nonomuraea sp. NPDC003709 TaxID=3154450 RepID=UPI0033B4F33D